MGRFHLTNHVVICLLTATTLMSFSEIIQGAPRNQINKNNKTEETVNLNLVEAEIAAVASTVSQITGKNFIVDPRVKGKVTIISSSPLDKNAVYQVFLSVLEVHGFAAVPGEGGIIKIIPDANAKQSAIINATNESPGTGSEIVTRVIDIKNIQAAQLVPILRPLVAQQGHLAAYPQNNTLIISDRADNVQRLVEIIRRIDFPSRNEVELIPLQHASATEIVRILSNLTQQERNKEGNPQTGMALVADERTNTVLLGGEKDDRIRLRAIISHLDTPNKDTSGNTKVIYLRYAQAKDLVAILTGVSKGAEKSSRSSTAGAAVPSMPQAVTTAPISSAGGSGGGPFKDVSIEADEATNALVITAPPEQLRTILSVIRQLDIRRAQVLVEAIIADVSATRANELGVQWGMDGYNSGGPVGIVNFPRSGGAGIGEVIAGVAAGGANKASALGNALGTGLNLAVGDLAGNFRFAALVRALSSDGSSNILSTPNLVTLDNQEAEIVVGTNVPFITGSYSNSNSLSSLNNGGLSNSYVSNPFQTIQRQDVGLTLKVKPQINEGNSVKLEIQQEVSALTTPPQGISTSDVVTSKRSIKTTVLVDDGQVIVLGGLIDDQIQESQNKVPLLGDLPVIGTLFRSNSNNVNKRNLMIFLHPIILRDAAVMARVSNTKYGYMRDRQLEAMNPESRPKETGLILPPLGHLETSGTTSGLVHNNNNVTTTEMPLELPPPFEDDETMANRFFENNADARP